MALKSLLEGSWDALGAFLDPQKLLLIGSWAVLRKFETFGSPKEVLDLGSTGNGKRIPLQWKDQTNCLYHARRSIQYHFDLVAILCHPVPASK